MFSWCKCQSDVCFSKSLNIFIYYWEEIFLAILFVYSFNASVRSIEGVCEGD